MGAGDKEFWVEKVVGSKTEDGELFYLVRWFGEDPMTNERWPEDWQRAENLEKAPGYIEAYYANLEERRVITAEGSSDTDSDGGADTSSEASKGFEDYSAPEVGKYVSLNEIAKAVGEC